MTNSPYVFDGTRENFSRLVLENSARGPVMVNYWTPRAGPCMVLMPRLVQLATEYGGRFLLVMVNTDEQGSLSREFGVTSVPTVKLFRNGQVVRTIHGAESDQEFRKAIDNFVARESDRAHALALQTYQRGDLEQACTLLAAAALEDPSNIRIPLDLAKLLVLKHDYDQAETLLASLLAGGANDPELGTLSAHVGFLRVAESAPPQAELEQQVAANGDDCDARYQLGAVKLVADDFEGALEQLLEIARRDRTYRHDAGRRGIIAVLDMLGPQHPLTIRYRTLLANALQ